MSLSAYGWFVHGGPAINASGACLAHCDSWANDSIALLPLRRILSLVVAGISLVACSHTASQTAVSIVPGRG